MEHLLFSILKAIIFWVNYTFFSSASQANAICSNQLTNQPFFLKTTDHAPFSLP